MCVPEERRELRGEAHSPGKVHLPSALHGQINHQKRLNLLLKVHLNQVCYELLKGQIGESVEVPTHPTAHWKYQVVGRGARLKLT